MAKLTRVTGKVFGGSAPLSEIGQFGSALAGTKVNTQDVATIQALEAYSNGWGSAILTSRNFPPIEEVTGALKTISYQGCYLLQEGIPEYDINTEYSATSIVKTVVGSELILYISKVDNNIGNALSNTTYWARAIFTGTGAIGAPQFTLNMNAVLPDNCIWLEGAEVLRADYPNLFAIYGTDYGTPTDNTKFFLPNYKNFYVCGTDNAITAGYVNAALPNLGLSTTTAGGHTHNRGDMNITGAVWNTSDYSDVFDGVSVSGAFSGSTRATLNVDSHANIYQAGCINILYFNAASSWTGQTSQNGGHTHTITSSSPLVGASNTVKTNGIKHRVYTRYQ